MKKSCIYLKERKGRNGEKKGEVMKKGEEKRIRGGRWEVWRIGTRYPSIWCCRVDRESRNVDVAFLKQRKGSGPHGEGR